MRSAHRLGIAIVVAIVVPVVAATTAATAVAAGPEGPPWSERVAAARDYADRRPGTVSFAIIGESGRFVGGYRRHNQVSSASVIKSMLLVAYLRRGDVRDRRLRPWERKTLRPMIERSADDPASSIFAIVGRSGLRRLARHAQMDDFATNPRWGLSQISAADMARYFYRIDDLTPTRHRRFVLNLFAHIIPKQQWGVPPVTPRGFVWRIKGGWINGVVNQVALLTQGERRLSVAVLVEGTPDTEAEVQHHPGKAAGPRTITGVTKRLLRDYGSSETQP